MRVPMRPLLSPSDQRGWRGALSVNSRGSDESAAQRAVRGWIGRHLLVPAYLGQLTLLVA